MIGSSYACRTVYNEPNGRFSQHAFANAVDLPIFVLANGRKVDVTHGWGQTKRDLTAAATPSTAATGISTQQKSGTNKNVAAADLVKVSSSQIPKDQKQAQATAASPGSAPSAEAKFLRRILQGACQTFSTVLGPEANNVHRSHFHLDLQERNSAQVCK